MNYDNNLAELTATYNRLKGNKLIMSELEEECFPYIKTLLNIDEVDDEAIHLLFIMYAEYYAYLKNNIDIIVLGSGKTGTTSIRNAIGSCNRSHGLFLDGLLKEKFIDSHLKYEALTVIDICFLYWAKENKKNIKIIFTFRDPVITTLSRYFYRKYVHPIRREQTKDSLLEDIKYIYTNDFINKIKTQYNRFTREIKEAFDFDIDNILNIENSIIIKTEDNMKLNEDKISKFLHRSIKITHDNKTDISNYRDIINNYTLPKDVVEDIYNGTHNNFLKQIYTLSDYENFIKRWSK